MVEWLVGGAVVLMMFAGPCAVGWVTDNIGIRLSSEENCDPMPWLDRWVLGIGIIGIIGLCIVVPWGIGSVVLGATGGG